MERRWRVGIRVYDCSLNRSQKGGGGGGTDEQSNQTDINVVFNSCPESTQKL